MEGNATTGQINSLYHRNNAVDLRDPDAGTALTSFTTFSRDTSTNILESWVTNVQNNLCLKCHDADGASSPDAQTPGGTALRPFTSNTRDVPDIFSRLDPTNSFHHAVISPGNNPYCSPTSTNGNKVTMEPPWNQTPGSHDLISCFDCHEANGHGGSYTGMLRVETYYDEPTVNPDLDIAMKVFCTRCHKASVYVQGGNGSRFQKHSKRPHLPEDDGGKNKYGCRGCHAGIYDDDANAGCENGAGVGVIHGGSFTWPACSKTPGSQTLRFLLGGYLSGWKQKSSTKATCYGGSCHHTNGKDY